MQRCHLPFGFLPFMAYQATSLSKSGHFATAEA